MSKTGSEKGNEQRRVNHVLDVIDHQMLKLNNDLGNVKEEVINIRKRFWDDVSINLDNFDEVIETAYSIRQQAEFLSERERKHRLSYTHLKNLERLKNSPYFARIDIKEEHFKESESIYIGINSLMDKQNENFLIYDWRAPISSVYYDHVPGPVHYETPEGTIHGTMELKRQFIIRDGSIRSMFDTSVTVGDELLQEVLGNQSDTKMKSIVATIQREQNRIIRDEKAPILIVQGVAGSGKTSAALQRVAYLLYRYRKTMNSQNIMLFSPNHMFNSYVSTVLPELGEDNMQQTTYQEYAENRLHHLFQLETPQEQMEWALSSEEDPNRNTRMAAIFYKSSLDFKEHIDLYVSYLSEQNITFKPIMFKSDTLLTAESIQHYFYSLDKMISIPNRMQLVSEWLLKKIKRIEREERKKDWVLDEIELLDKEDYLKAYRTLQKDGQMEKDTFDDVDREQKLLAKIVVKKYFKPIRKAIKQFDFIDMEANYLNLFTFALPYKVTLPADWEEMCKFTIDMLERKTLCVEDATPFLYLQDHLEGNKSNTMIRHLFIDEAQDFSPFQFAFLRQLFPKSKMTILGDLNQAIHAHTIHAPTLLDGELFEEGEYERITLKKSYRSTRQIVEFTKPLIEGGDEIEAFNRDGKKPTLTTVDDHHSLHKQIADRIENLQREGHQTIAILCKTAKEAQAAFEQLDETLDTTIQLIDTETAPFVKGTLLVPIYLAKGIEFDAVIVYNASNRKFNDPLERKLLYTACTRAMHELHIFSVGKVTHFLSNVSDTKYITS